MPSAESVQSLMGATTPANRPSNAAARHATPRRRCTAPSGTAQKELGVLMLLLAAETVADCCNASRSSTSDAIPHHLPPASAHPENVVGGMALTSTDLIARHHRSLLHAASASSPHCMSNNKVIVSAAAHHQQLHSIAAGGSAEPAGFDGVSSAGESDTAGTPVPDVDPVDVGLNVVLCCDQQQSQHSRLRVMSGGTVQMILSCLDWRENLRLRGVNRTWFEASVSQAVLCRLPVSATPAIFIPCHRNLDALEASDESRLRAASAFTTIATPITGSPNAEAMTMQQSWVCTACGWYNADAQLLCHNRACHALAPFARLASASNDSAVNALGSEEPPKATRIFLGQLRREGTVPLIRWIFEDVLLQPKALLMVENHRHKITGRGKGCAWIYVRHDDEATQGGDRAAGDHLSPSPSSSSAVAAILSYHRRIFVDVVNGVEGVWLVHPAHLDGLQRDVAARGYAADRPRTLPRNALVTELPLAQVMRMNAPASVVAGGVEMGSMEGTPVTGHRQEQPCAVNPSAQEPIPKGFGAAKTTQHKTPTGSALSPFAAPFVSAAATASLPPPPSYEESTKEAATRVVPVVVPSPVEPAHMISPTVRRHNPYAPATCV